jgi:hypothetical protein
MVRLQQHPSFPPSFFFPRAIALEKKENQIVRGEREAEEKKRWRKELRVNRKTECLAL